jgi:large subunit ribosomal protein L21
MYAVIADRGKQYLVRPGERVRVDLRAEAPGSKVLFDRVLFVGGDGGARAGRPILEGAVVEATVVGEIKDKKLIVFHKRRRKGMQRKAGHRQRYTDLMVEKLSLGQ